MGEAFHVLALETTGAGITAQVLVPPDCGFFQGHFPGEPILPGVAQVVLIAHLLEVHLRRTVSVTAVRRVKFTSPVRPGTTLTARLDLRHLEVRFHLFGPEGEVSSGEITIRQGGA